MRHFTVEEANAALETVRPLTERMVARRRQLLRLQEELAPLRRAVAGNGGGLNSRRVAALEEKTERAVEAIQRCVEEIRALGAQVKELDLGLVDFPALRAGDEAPRETVLLCWRLGEAEIGYWHGVEEGFAGRKPLPL